MRMLGPAIAGPDHLTALVPTVEALGQRHAAYGVLPEHYATVGRALLWKLRQGLGAAFDGAHEAAWTRSINYSPRRYRLPRGNGRFRGPARVDRTDSGPYSAGAPSATRGELTSGDSAIRAAEWSFASKM